MTETQTVDPGLTAGRLSTMALEVHKRASGAKLVRNAVGNLAVMLDGEMVGWMDFSDGNVYWVEDS